MMKRFTCLALGLLCSAMTQADTWVDLFNGKDLTGWKVSDENPGSFQVSDGVLIAHGPRAHLFYTGSGEVKESMKNFEFEALVKTFPEANSGIFFHTHWQESGWPEHGYEAQVNASHRDPRKTASIYAVQDVMDQAPHADGEWFKYHIRVEGKKVTIRINDKVVNEFTEPADPGHATRRLDAGTIALQAHDPKSVVHYKNLRLRKLP